MNICFHEVKYKGFTIKLCHDLDPPNPRQWQNLGKMLCKHTRYILGDAESENLTAEDIISLVKRKDVISLPLYLLDHSGLWMRTSSFECDPGGFDTSFVGYIVTTHDDIKKWFKKRRITDKLINQAKEVLRQEVKTYSAFLEGNVIGYIIEKRNKIIDSCWGYYPEDDDYDYIITECKTMIDNYYVNKREVNPNDRNPNILR